MRRTGTYPFSFFVLPLKRFFLPLARCCANNIAQQGDSFFPPFCHRLTRLRGSLVLLVLQGGEGKQGEGAAAGGGAVFFPEATTASGSSSGGEEASSSAAAAGRHKREGHRGGAVQVDIRLIPS